MKAPLKPIDWPRVAMDAEERAAALITYPTPSPLGFVAGSDVVAFGGEASEPLAGVYVGHDPTAGHKSHVVCVLTPSGRVDLRVSQVWEAGQVA